MTIQLNIGDKVLVNEKGWARYHAEGNRPVLNPNYPQYIESMPSQPPFHESVLLSFPFFWFKEDEVDKIQ